MELKQYCRYCSHLFAGNGIWCEIKQKELAESTAKRTNNCKSFELNPMDAFAENPNEYKPRCSYRPHRKKENFGEQLSLRFEKGAE